MRTIRSAASLLLTALAWAASAAAAPPPPAIVTGQDAGWPDVRAWDRFGTAAQGLAPWGTFPVAFSPYPTYQNGVRVAVGDVDGDGRGEIVTAPGTSAFTELRVFDGRTFARRSGFLPFRNGVWWNGAFVAAGDTTGDGRDELVNGLDSGCCTMLHVLDGLDGHELSGFFPFGDREQLGVRVAAADLDTDGKSELLAVPVGSTRVRAFAPSGGSPFRSFDTFAGGTAGGAAIAAGDVTGDARPELVVAAPTAGGAQVKAIDVQTGATLLSLFPFRSLPAVSLEVAVGDVDGDGNRDLVVAAQLPDGTQVKALDALGRELGAFYVLDPGLVPGVSLAVGDLDGDHTAEIVLGGGKTNAPWPPVANGPDQRVVVYDVEGVRRGAFSAYPGLFQGGVRVALADVDDDARPEIVTAPGAGMEPEVAIFTQDWVETRDRGTRLAHFLAFEERFRGGVSVAAGDVDGDGTAELVVAPGPGRPPEIRVLDARGRLRSSFLAFEAEYLGGVSVAVGDLDADGRAEVVAGTLTAPARVRAFSRGTPFGPLIGSLAPDATGVHVGVADLDGDGSGVILAGSATGPHPLLSLVDPRSGSVVDSFEPAPSLPNGIYVAGGDLDRDGRDEILVTPGWGGDSRVRVLGRRLAERTSFLAYSFDGAGMSVAASPRIGLPIAADGRTLRLRARTRTRVVVARFRDAAGATGTTLRATIDWGDGTRWNGVVVDRGGGVYDVRSSKRYARPARYAIRVTLADGGGRSSVARGAAIVSRR